MSSKQLVKILQIAEEIHPGGFVTAEHDIIYILSCKYVVSQRDKERLNDAGANIEDDFWVVYV